MNVDAEDDNHHSVLHKQRREELLLRGWRTEVHERKDAWGCRGVDEYNKLNNITEGAYGVVYRGQDKKTGAQVALKRIKMEHQGAKV